MDLRQGRRMIAIALLFGCFLVTTWIEDQLTLQTFDYGSERAKRSIDQPRTKRDLDELMKDHQIKDDIQYQETRKKILARHGITEEDLIDDKEDKEEEERLRNEEEKRDEDLEEHYSKILEERAREIKQQVYRCIPKFICEVHSQTSDKITTDIEREWLKFSIPDLLSDHNHEFQMAAHMGQLFHGYQPSPCNQMYTNCPISMTLLKKFLQNISIKRGAF